MSVYVYVRFSTCVALNRHTVHICFFSSQTGGTLCFICSWSHHFPSLQGLHLEIFVVSLWDWSSPTATPFCELQILVESPPPLVTRNHGKTAQGAWNTKAFRSQSECSSKGVPSMGFFLPCKGCTHLLVFRCCKMMPWTSGWAFHPVTLKARKINGAISLAFISLAFTRRRRGSEVTLLLGIACWGPRCR